MGCCFDQEMMGYGLGHVWDHCNRVAHNNETGVRAIELRRAIREQFHLGSQVLPYKQGVSFKEVYKKFWGIQSRPKKRGAMDCCGKKPV